MPTPSARAKNGPSTAIWVAWARIASILASKKSVPSTLVVTRSSGVPMGSSSALVISSPQKLVSPRSRK